MPVDARNGRRYDDDSLLISPGQSSNGDASELDGVVEINLQRRIPFLFIVIPKPRTVLWLTQC